MNFLLTAIVGFSLALATSLLQAATIAINPTSDSAATGGTVDFSFEASNFDTSGGAFDLSWDPAVLTYNGNFAFDTAFGIPPRQPLLDVIDFQAPGLLSIGFGNFFGISFGSTPTTIGSLSFTMGGSPGDVTALTMVNSSKWGGFFDTAFPPDLITMTYVNGQATNRAPIPATVWLLVCGLGIVGLFGKRRETRRSTGTWRMDRW